MLTKFWNFLTGKTTEPVQEAPYKIESPAVVQVAESVTVVAIEPVAVTTETATVAKIKKSSPKPKAAVKKVAEIKTAAKKVAKVTK